jgi:hypothetical protein
MNAVRLEVVIDGRRFSSFYGFVGEFNRAYVTVFGGPEWDGDDFGDLYDMLSLPKDRYTVRWEASAKSRSDLGYEAMEEFWRSCLDECKEAFPKVMTLLDGYADNIELAASKRGRTMFDYLVEQLQDDEHFDLHLE